MIPADIAAVEQAAIAIQREAHSYADRVEQETLKGMTKLNLTQRPTMTHAQAEASARPYAMLAREVALSAFMAGSSHTMLAVQRYAPV